MLLSIFVALILNSMFPTYCYVQPWHHLRRVRETFPQETDVEPPNTPDYRYEVHPGSQGMFSDVAREIETRMRGIANGPFVVVFDFGGIARKYFSIIEDVLSESVAVLEPRGIEKSGMSADGESPSKQSMVLANPMLTTRSMTSVADTVTSAVESPVNILQGSPSAGVGGDSTIEEDLAITPSGLEDGNSPISTVRIKSLDAMENILPTSSDANDNAVTADGQRSLLLDSTTLSSIQDSAFTDTVDGLNDVGAVEFPGETTIALSYPDHQMSVTDNTTNEKTYFTALTNATVNSVDAHALYSSLKPVTTELSLVIKNRGFNCVPLKSTKLDLKLYVVDNIVFGKGNICGLENMVPGNNITITKDGENFIQVAMPLIFKDLTVKIESVDVSNYFFTMIKGQPIEASVKEISCKGTFSFKRGTSFQLSSVRIEWGEISGIHIKLEGALEEGDALSGIVDNLAEAVSGIVKSFIAPILHKIEKQITKNIVVR